MAPLVATRPFRPLGAMSRKRSLSINSGQDPFTGPRKKYARNKQQSHQNSPRKKQTPSASPPTSASMPTQPSQGPKAAKAMPFEAGHEVDLSIAFAPQVLTPAQPNNTQPGMTEELEQKIQAREELSCLISDKWPRNLVDKRPGFNNFTGVLCYRHSLFQAILHIPKFINWLHKCHKPENCCTMANNCVACAFYILVEIYWYGRPTEEYKNVSAILKRLDSVLSARGWKTDDWSEQGDPDEQFAKMMEFIHLDMGNNQAEQFMSIYATLVGTSIHCSSCGHSTTPNISELANFSIGLAPHLNGQKLGRFFKEYMEDHSIEDYRCEGCKQKVRVSKLTKIYSPADIVTVQIKRANFVGRGMSRTEVALTEKLNLTKYSATPNVQLQYELVSTVCYVGDSRSGHYIAHGLGPNGDWKAFDDNSTSPSNVFQALGSARRDRFDPVLLYYKRIYEKPESNQKSET